MSQLSRDAMALIIPPAPAVLFCSEKPRESPCDEGCGSATPRHPPHFTGSFALSMRFVIVLEVLLLPYSFMDIYSRVFKVSFT